MKTVRTLIAVFALCAALSACTQPTSFTGASSFPTYGASAGGSIAATSIMDY